MEIDKAILHYCKYQERCHTEVRNKLYELGCSTNEVGQQISELINAGVLNEERFAVAYARGKFRMKQWGKVKIKQQLKFRGISEYCIKKAMNEIDPDEYDMTLKKLAAKKTNELRNEKNVFSRKAKLYRFLMQKGFEKDLIIDLINQGI